MTRIKHFMIWDCHEIESEINNWIEGHEYNLEILSIQYSMIIDRPSPEEIEAGDEGGLGHGILIQYRPIK